MNRRQVFAALAAFGAASAAAVTPPPRRTEGRREITTGGQVRLHHQDMGDGPAIVFVSGWALSSQMWNYQTPVLLQQGFRCVTYDRRGHGRSDDPGRGYDFDTLADDLAAVLEALDLQDVTLVGHSMAAGEMTRYMSRHRARRVKRLLYLAPAATPYPEQHVAPAVFEAMRTGQLMRDFPKWLRDNARPFVTPETSESLLDWLFNMMTSTSMPALIGCHRSLTGTDFRGELPFIGLPTLVIHGTRDASAPIDLTGRPTAEMIPAADLLVYDGAPHGLFVTHAERLNADIAAFARS